MKNSDEKAYHLTIRIHSEAIAIEIRETSGMIVSSKTLQTNLSGYKADQIAAILRSETEINHYKASIIWESDTYTFVPSDLFTQQECSHYLSFQHKIPKNEKVVFNAIPVWDIVNVFTIPSGLLQAIQEVLPGIPVEHHMSFLLSNNIKKTSATDVHLNIRNKMADIVILKESKLYLLNSYPCQTAEDFVYHTLNPIEQLGIEIDNTRLILHNSNLIPEVEKLLNNYLSVSTI